MSRRTGLLTRATAIAAAAVFVVGAGLSLAEDGGEGDQPVDFTHNVVAAPVAGAVFGTQGTVKPGKAICTTTTSSAANVNTDCEKAPGPHNETSIAVNPTDHNNIIGGANDYQLGLNPGGHVTETILSRAHVSFDGGQTWSMYPLIANSAYQATGDPARCLRCRRHAPTTRRSASASSAPSTRTTRMSSSPLQTTRARPGPPSRSPHGSGIETQRRRPARQGVRRGLG